MKHLLRRMIRSGFDWKIPIRNGVGLLIILTACVETNVEPTPIVLQSYPVERPTTIELADETDPSQRLVINGTIYANNHHTLVSGAFITVWHTDAEGRYGTYRGTGQSDGQGNYQLKTIVPSSYQVDDTTKRAAHIHFEISAVGMRPVSGEILFEGDPDLKIDPVVLETAPEVLATRIIPLKIVEGPSGSYLQGRFDLILLPP